MVNRPGHLPYCSFIGARRPCSSTSSAVTSAVNRRTARGAGLSSRTEDGAEPAVPPAKSIQDPGSRPVIGSRFQNPHQSAVSRLCIGRCRLNPKQCDTEAACPVLPELPRKTRSFRGSWEPTWRPLPFFAVRCFVHFGVNSWSPSAAGGPDAIAKNNRDRDEEK